MNNWIIFAIFGGLFSSIFNYGFRNLLKNGGDSTSLAWLFETFRVLILLVVLPFDFFVNFNSLTLFLLLLIGLIEFVSIYYYSKMHKENHLSISTIIVRLRVVWIPILAFFLIGESLSLISYIGIVVVFAGLSFVSSPKQLFYDRGVLISFVCSIITAVLIILVKLLSTNASPILITFSMSLPSVFLFPLLVKNWKKRVILFYKDNRFGSFAIAFASVVTMYLQIIALSLGPAGKVSGIFQGMSIVAVLAGIFILGEKEKVWQKVIGSTIVIVGAYLLI